MKTCEIKKIISIPGGVFTNTGIKTCILYFYKRQELTEVCDMFYDKNKEKI